MERRVNQSTAKMGGQTPSKATRVSEPVSGAPKTRKRKYRFALFKQPTFLQNPFIEYWDAKSRRKRAAKHHKPEGRVRVERQILTMLAFFGVSIGLWENFRQLWLLRNGFSPAGVSNIVSFGLIVSVVGILIVGKVVKMPKIRYFMAGVLILRTINMLFLCSLDLSLKARWISVGVVIDVVTGVLIVTSVYPLLTTVMKSNRAYSRRKLVEYLFRDVGILIGALVIGRQIGAILVNYNVCLFMSALFSAGACYVMCRIKPTMNEHAPASKFSAIKFVLRTRIQRWYMAYAFFAGAAYMAAISLRMLVLTDYFGFSPRMSTSYLLLVGLAADFLGIIALRHFTPKNDYLTIAIKFGTRILIFAGAFFSGDLFLSFIALTWTLLSSTAYENITDGYYINSVDNRHQLKYNTVKYVATTVGEAVGTFLCGQMFGLGVNYIFGMAGTLVIIQVVLASRLIYLRHRQAKKLR